MGDSIPYSVPTWFLFGSYLVPSRFLAALDAFKIGPLKFSTTLFILPNLSFFVDSHYVCIAILQ
jgi:hypothetical protein